MKSNKSKYLTTVALIWAACAILIFFAYMLVIGPQRKEKASVANRLIQQKRTYKTALKADDKQVQTKLAGQVANLRDRVGSFVVPFSDAANLTFDISQTARMQGIEVGIQSEQVRTRPGQKEYKCIKENRFDVSLTSGFTEFAALLSAMERHEPALFVDNFSINRAAVMGEGHDAKMSLTVLVKKQ